MKQKQRKKAAGARKMSAQLPAGLTPLARLVEQKRYAELEQAARDTLRTLPTHPYVLKALSFALIGQGKFEAAIPGLELAVRLSSADPELHNNLGICLSAMMRWEKALVCFDRALALGGSDPDIWKNKGAALSLMHRWNEAVPFLVKAIELFPGDYDEAIDLLAGALLNAGRNEEAFACYTELYRSAPERAAYLGCLIVLGLRLCHWEGQAQAIQSLRHLSEGFTQSAVTPFHALAIPGLAPQELRQIAECQARFSIPPGTLGERRLATRKSLPSAQSRRLRLGYLSYDFKDHPVAHVLPQIIELHDRERVEVFGYSMGPDDGSDIRQRLIRGFDHFTDIRSLGIEASAQKIANDEIDILVDLQGWTTGGRSEMLALRPAPIQVSWLGYAGSMGSSRLADYLIGDSIVTPETDEAFFTEEIVRLPHCYLPLDTTQHIGNLPSRAEAGLPEDAFVFCSLNNCYKLNPQVLDIWCRILGETPASCLWLLRPGASGAENLLAEVAARGISTDRIVFASFVRSRADYLGRLQLADLALDPFPYNSHSSGMDTLWAGVPMITLLGNTFAGRVGASLLGAAGLHECITRSSEEYRQLCLELYRQPDRLQQLRQRLVNGRKTAPLFDMPQFARSLEDIYLKVSAAGSMAESAGCK